MLTTFTTDDYVLRALRAGAAGFLLKHTRPETIIDAVRRTSAGEPVMSPEALRHLVDAVAHKPPAQHSPAPPRLTTPAPRTPGGSSACSATGSGRSPSPWPTAGPTRRSLPTST